MPFMKTSVIITNYNYRRFVFSAIESVLQQTMIPDEVIIVDDGSCDDSLDIIEQYRSCPRVKIISKANGGQLSAFNAGYTETTGDLIFFLDADDIYAESYVEEACHYYEKHPECDFLYVGFEEFGTVEREMLAFPHDVDHGYSVADVFFNGIWIGGPTSTNSMRRAVLDKILPLNLEESWRICADNCFVHGASLVGARKHYYNNSLIKYRVHANNGYYHRLIDHDYIYRIMLKHNVLFEHIVRKNFISVYEYTRKQLDEEFASGGKCDRNRRNRYDRIARKLFQNRNISFQK